MKKKRKAFPILAFIGFCIALSLPFFFGVGFEDRYYAIMAGTSMKDDTDSMTMEEKQQVRQVMNDLFFTYGVRANYHITTEEGFKPQYTGEQSLFVGINLDTQKVRMYFPKIMKTAFQESFAATSQEIEDQLAYCVQFVPRTPVSQCLRESYESILKLLNSIPK